MTPRERDPGKLSWLPGTDHERFLLAEALRYRRALIKIEERDFRGHPSTGRWIARKVLDEGEDAALRGEGSSLV